MRFVDGSEAPLRRSEFTLLKEAQAAAAGAGHVLDDFDLFGCVVYRCVIGSRAYGLAGDASDTDRRGIYLPPADMHWSLYGVPEQLENPATQEAYWEFQKFLVLALKANPNVLECLYTPLVEYAAPLVEELRAMRSAFLSKLVYQTYNGYVLSQFKKLDAHLARHGTVKWKHAMHLIRLLLAGIVALRAGHVPGERRRAPRAPAGDPRRAAAVAGNQPLAARPASRIRCGVCGDEPAGTAGLRAGE